MKKKYYLNPMRYLLAFIIIYLIPPAYSFSAPAEMDCSGSGSINDPHIPNGPGPWFEGWYTRVSDDGGSRSVAVIVATYLPKGETYVSGEYLTGYINVLVCDGDGAPTTSYTVFPEQTMALVNGEPVSKNPKISCKKESDFEWVAVGYGGITEDSVDINIPGIVDVKIKTTNRLPWSSKDSSRSIEGWMAYFPFPTHWWINSLGSDAEYEYKIYDDDDSETFSGTGYAEQEKNWSLIFPEAWLWSQGISEGNTSQYVLTSTKVELFPGFNVFPWLASYRSPKLSWNFNFMWAGSYIKTEKDPCAGTCLITFRDPFRSLIFDMSAPPESFGDVSIPTADGFIPEMGGESFSMTVKVSAYRHYPFCGKKKLIDTQIFNNTVLEFGNAWRCLEK